MWITFWEKAWKFGVLYLYLLCKIKKYEKQIKSPTNQPPHRIPHRYNLSRGCVYPIGLDIWFDVF